MKSNKITVKGKVRDIYYKKVNGRTAFYIRFKKLSATNHDFKKLTYHNITFKYISPFKNSEVGLLKPNDVISFKIDTLLGITNNHFINNSKYKISTVKLLNERDYIPLSKNTRELKQQVSGKITKSAYSNDNISYRMKLHNHYNKH